MFEDSWKNNSFETKRDSQNKSKQLSNSFQGGKKYTFGGKINFDKYTVGGNFGLFSVLKRLKIHHCATGLRKM